MGTMQKDSNWTIYIYVDMLIYIIIINQHTKIKVREENLKNVQTFNTFIDMEKVFSNVPLAKAIGRQKLCNMFKSVNFRIMF